MAFAGKRILITGATSGIGAATAEAFCKAGCEELILVGRREELLKERAKAWSDAYGVDVAAVVLDVGSRADIEGIARDHPNLFEVDILVNNAGLAKGRDAMQDAELDDWEEMVQTNVLGAQNVIEAALDAGVCCPRDECRRSCLRGGQRALVYRSWLKYF